MNETVNLCDLLRQVIIDVEQAAKDSKLWPATNIDKLVEKMAPLWKAEADLNYPGFQIAKSDAGVQGERVEKMVLKAYRPASPNVVRWSRILQIGPDCECETILASELLGICPIVEAWIDWLEVQPPKVTVETFKYYLATATGEGIQAETERPEIRSLIQTKNAQLVYAAVEAGLGDFGMSADEAARRFIRWAVGKIGKPRDAVIWWTVDEAIARLESNILPEHVSMIPNDYVLDWAELMDALGRRNTEPDRKRIRRISDSTDGPIKMPKGGQPKLLKSTLLVWWQGLGKRWQELAEREELAEKEGDKSATVAGTYNYGKTAEVVPQIGGSVKTKRKKGSKR